MLFYKCYPQIDELLVKYAYKSFDLYVTQFVSYGVEKEVAEKDGWNSRQNKYVKIEW